MAEISTPDDKTFEETNPVALAYYHREPGYTVDGEDRTGTSTPQVSTAKALKVEPPASPAPSS
jgi:hypothetical protein